MRMLDFTVENGAEMYEALYSGLVGSTRGYEAPSETRVLSKVLDAMEAVGVSSTVEGNATFVLKEGGGVVLLEDAEYTLMDSAISSTKWRATAVRKVTKAVEWFKAAPVPPKPEISSDAAK